MGENEGWADPGGPLPSGLLPGAGPVMRALDTDRWSRAEERTAELIDCIQPNQLSEERRNAVADYVQRLIMKCFPCQVCTFGSVPLKTYLPDGDIDLTAFSHDQNLKDTWANQVRDMLEKEEKNEKAKFHVKEVQYIQAEVKIIKCLVENIVVDISFNQVGGLCTLCFLDEVDNLINQNHLFKRSIILIKAWCYYESRILGAHHGLISTYALETLVLYIFHVFNNSFHGPLEVLYRFLEFFSNFDWDNFCVSLWGPVPISSLPDVTAEPPRKDSGELLLSKVFLEACSTVYAVFPSGQENNGQPFVSKHFNVIDPLRVNNNLGRSVSKGNFFRIRSAFGFGAKRLANLLDCPKENLIFEVNQFFMNTWERHGSGHRPDAAGLDLWRMRLSTPDSVHNFGNSSNNMGGIKVNESSSACETGDNGIHGHGVSARTMPTASELSAASHIQSLKMQSGNSLRVTDQIGRDNTYDKVLNDEVQRDTKADHLVNDTQGRFLFARTHSSPELTDAYGDISSQTRRNRQVETANAHATSARLDKSNRRKNQGSESLAGNTSHSSVEDTSSARPVSSQQNLDAAATESNNYHRDLHLDALSDEFSSTSGAQVTHQEEQDIVNMMASASLQGFNGQLHVPFNLSSSHLPFSIPPSFLASVGYTQRNLPGFVPTNIPMIDPSFSNVQFPHGLISPLLTHYFPGIGMNSPSEASFERSNEKFGSLDRNTEELDNDFWQEQDACSSSGYDPENGNFERPQSDDKPPTSVSGLKYVPPHRASGSGSAPRVQQNHSREKHGSIRQSSESFPIHDDRSSEVYAEERSASSRFSSATPSNSLRSRTSSESSWDGSSVKTPKSSKEKRGKKMVSTDLATGHGKSKFMSEHVPNQAEDDEQEWVSSSNMGTEMVERNPASEPVASLQVSGHHMAGFDVAQTSGSDSVIPFAPMLIGPGSRHRMNDNSGLIAFYPTGPPIPFLTMLPVYNVPPETGTSDASSGHFGGGDEILENSESEQNFNAEGDDHSEDFNPSSSLRGTTSTETSAKKKTDILNSDFASHWQNLQFGSFCQNPRYPGPLLYPSPVMVPPGYLQSRFPYDNPSRPFSTNMNLLSQRMTSNGPHLVPAAPRKVSARERHSSGNRRGNYNHDRNDNCGDREGNWNANSKSRGAAVRNHSRSQTDKSNSRADRFASTESRADRSWNSHRSESFPSYQSRNGPVSSNSSQNGPQNVAYSMYPLAATNPNGISNGPAVPPVMMLYPFDHNNAYVSHGEQLEFGSLGPVGLPGTDEQSQLNEASRVRAFEDHRLHGNSMRRSSPDQPSSPHHQRRV
ncbi:Polynucleotide adenylyltransferase [Handroanthus impetiginosus]|uniref:Polynucleotide adenylyltransferase n=1 Tax=Handroanthus impetiginosus TaxID=429701 RepID=A0A2G9H9B7_9LAMI|nr:Polynucleotide adenylyltransferase [Handroanthus impetiginosus]